MAIAMRYKRRPFSPVVNKGVGSWMAQDDDVLLKAAAARRNLRYQDKVRGEQMRIIAADWNNLTMRLQSSAVQIQNKKKT